MSTAENAKLQYEAGQNAVAASEISQVVGLHTIGRAACRESG